jgi:hypothetical protein
MKLSYNLIKMQRRMFYITPGISPEQINEIPPVPAKERNAHGLFRQPGLNIARS